MNGWLQDTLGLFGPAYATALLLALSLPFLGVALTLRRRLFTAAAVSQSAALGFAVGMVLGVGEPDHGHGPCGLSLLACGALGGAMAGWFSMRRQRPGDEGLDGWSVVLFLLGGSGSMALLADAPHGLQDIQRLQLSSLLGAGGSDVLVGLLLVVVTGALTFACGRRALLVLSDEAAAVALGLRVGRYRAAIGVWLGLGLAFAIHATGLLYAFGCAVLPTLIAREFASSLRSVLWQAPLWSVGTVAFALWLSQQEGVDLPPGQAAATVQALTAAAAMALRGRR